MPTGKGERTKGSRVWPGVIWPLGPTLLLALAVWMFVGKVAADQERADAAALRLEGYARLEAGDLATRARNVMQQTVEARLAGRRNQEKNLRLEVRGVMDAVYRVLTANLEKSRKSAAARRDVGAFPPGFDGVRSFLEIVPAARKTDHSVDALRAIAPELSALLPSGCSLAIVEDNSRELLSVGGGAPAENAVAEAMTRDFLLGDGGGNRLWTIRVEVTAHDAFPVPDAKELAGAVTAELGGVRLDGVAWRGWLLGPGGQVAAPFPAAADGAPRRADPSLPPFIDKPEEWVEYEGQRLVWMERRAAPAGVDLFPAVAVAIDRPAPPLELVDELWRDTRWSVTLGMLALLFLAGWVWFVRTLLASGRAAADGDAPAPEPSRPEVSLSRGGSRVRVVRNEAAARKVPEVAEVIVADLDDGGVKVSAPAPERKAREPRAVPSGSLYRLQAMHRGGKSVGGSRVLDGARSPVLKELALRVRPALRVEVERRSGRGTERMEREVRKVGETT